MLLCFSNLGTQWSPYWWAANGLPSGMPGVELPSIRSCTHYSFGLSWLCIDWISCKYAGGKKCLSAYSTWNTIYLPDNQDPHINHKSTVFTHSQERTRMFFPHLEIQSDLHSNYAAFRMNHGPTPQCQCLAGLLARGCAALRWSLHLGVGFGEVLK